MRTLLAQSVERRVCIAFSGGYFVARFFQKRSRLSSPPKSVVKMVESASRMSPGRSLARGIQRNMLKALLPASVNGCGWDVSIGCCARRRIFVESSVVSA